MEESDLELVHSWRNHPSVRSVSGNSAKIPLKQHKVWFDCSNSSLKLMFEENGVPKGVVILDRNSWYWSFYLDPKVKGCGSLMLTLALRYFKLNEELLMVKAKVLKFNEKSVHLHKKLGFVRLKSKDSNFVEFRKVI